MHVFGICGRSPKYFRSDITPIPDPTTANLARHHHLCLLTYLISHLSALEATLIWPGKTFGAGVSVFDTGTTHIPQHASLGAMMCHQRCSTIIGQMSAGNVRSLTAHHLRDSNSLVPVGSCKFLISTPSHCCGNLSSHYLRQDYAK